MNLSPQEQEAVADLLADYSHPETELSADPSVLIGLARRLGFDDGSPTIKFFATKLEE